jgi:hypothetical protein
LEKGVKVSNLGVQKIFTFDFTIQRLTIWFSTNICVQIVGIL